MKLIHLANFGSTNVGNGALISGTERVLAEDLGAVTFIREAWDDYTFGYKTFDRTFVEFVNASDGLIVGAAVTLNGQAYQKETGTRLELPLPLWRQIKKPIVFYAISYRHWPLQRYHNLERFKETFRYILGNKNILFSVRNDGTKEWLEKMLGRTLPEIFVIPDPALFVVTEDHFHPELADGKTNIVLSLNNEDEVYRFGGKLREIFWRATPGMPEKTRLALFRMIPGWDRKRRMFLERLGKALGAVAAKRDVNVILCPHYFDDYRIISEFIPHTPLAFPHRTLVGAGMARVPATGYFYDLYRKADLALSMRIHSMSPAIGLGTPTVALTSQNRMEAFLQDAGLGEFALSIEDPALESKLLQKIERCLSEKTEIRKKLAAATALLRDRSRRFNITLGEFLKKNT